jgi:hypothetical protein
MTTRTRTKIRRSDVVDAFSQVLGLSPRQARYHIDGLLRAEILPKSSEPIVGRAGFREPPLQTAHLARVTASFLGPFGARDGAQTVEEAGHCLLQGVQFHSPGKRIVCPPGLQGAAHVFGGLLDRIEMLIGMYRLGSDETDGFIRAEHLNGVPLAFDLVTTPKRGFFAGSKILEWYAPDLPRELAARLAECFQEGQYRRITEFPLSMLRAVTEELFPPLSVDEAAGAVLRIDLWNESFIGAMKNGAAPPGVRAADNGVVFDLPGGELVIPTSIWLEDGGFGKLERLLADAGAPMAPIVGGVV